jgi:hypothetical protein
LGIDLSYCFSNRTFNYEGDLLIERSRLSPVTGCVMAILLGVFVYPDPTLAFEIQMLQPMS